MGIEIERKFLVRKKKLPVDLPPGSKITQGYLSRKPTVRIRQSVSFLSEAWITVKGKGDIQRSEFEYRIPYDDATSMLALCATGTISKTRYEIEVGDHTWELDEFHGALEGLWLAEIELDTEDEHFERPPWVGAEVSTDPRYSNAALAESGKAP